MVGYEASMSNSHLSDALTIAKIKGPASVAELRSLHVSTSPKRSGAEKDTTEYLKRIVPLLLYILGTLEIIKGEKSFNNK